MDATRTDSLNTRDLLAWVEGWWAGRPDAAEPTFRRIAARVEKFARKAFRAFPRVGRFVDFEDVLQDTLVRLLRAMRGFRPESTRHFYALTNQLIRRELLDLTEYFYGPRGAGARLGSVTVGDGPGDHVPADAGPPPSAELERMTAFHEAVADLPAAEREVIGLGYYHGWTAAQIADLLGVSVRTVRRWREAAVERLRERAGEVGVR